MACDLGLVVDEDQSNEFPDLIKLVFDFELFEGVVIIELAFVFELFEGVVVFELVILFKLFEGAVVFELFDRPSTFRIDLNFLCQLSPVQRYYIHS